MDERDALGAQLPADEAGVSHPALLDVLLEDQEGGLAVHAQDQVPARLHDPPQLGQPLVLVVLVDVGEDAVVEDEVEGGVGVVDGRQRLVGLERRPRHVVARPLDGPLVDVDPVEGRRGREVLEPEHDPAAAAAEVEDRLVIGQLAVDEGEDGLQVADRLAAGREEVQAVGATGDAVDQLLPRPGELVDVRFGSSFGVRGCHGRLPALRVDYRGGKRRLAGLCTDERRT